MSKITVFACLSEAGPNGSTIYRRAKITADPLKGGCTFYLFEGSEHAVCNHADTVLPKEHFEVFRTQY